MILHNSIVEFENSKEFNISKDVESQIINYLINKSYSRYFLTFDNLIYEVYTYPLTDDHGKRAMIKIMSIETTK